MLHTGQVGTDIKAFVVTTTTRRLPSTQIKTSYKSPQKNNGADFTPRKNNEENKSELANDQPVLAE